MLCGFVRECGPGRMHVDTEKCHVDCVGCMWGIAWVKKGEGVGYVQVVGVKHTWGGTSQKGCVSVLGSAQEVPLGSGLVPGRWCGLGRMCGTAQKVPHGSGKVHRGWHWSGSVCAPRFVQEKPWELGKVYGGGHRLGMVGEQHGLGRICKSSFFLVLLSSFPLS